MLETHIFKNNIKLLLYIYIDLLKPHIFLGVLKWSSVPHLIQLYKLRQTKRKPIIKINLVKKKARKPIEKKFKLAKYKKIKDTVYHTFDINKDTVNIVKNVSKQKR